MEIGEKPRVIKILTGHPTDVEDMIAALGSDYAITHWHFFNDGLVPGCTAVLIHGSVIRQMQIAQGGPNGPIRR